MARAKQTARAEARRKYRQAQVDPIGEDADDIDEKPSVEQLADRGKATAGRRPASARDARPPSGRLGFGAALRAAYHPAHIREDIAALPGLLGSLAFLAGLGTLAIGIAAAVYFRDYTGGLFALQLVVAPGSALLPQLVTGFFAPRASYLLGLLIGLVQGIAFVVLINMSMSTANGPLRLGDAFTQDMYNQAVKTSFLQGPLTSMLFAAGAAWYRRFLALSSSRAGARSAARGPSKSAPSRRPSGR